MDREERKKTILKYKTRQLREIMDILAIDAKKELTNEMDDYSISDIVAMAKMRKEAASVYAYLLDRWVDLKDRAEK